MDLPRDGELEYTFKQSDFTKLSFNFVVSKGLYFLLCHGRKCKTKNFH